MGVHSRHDSDAMSEGGEALPFLYPPPTKEVARCVVSRSRKKIEMEKGEDANERKRERDYCKVRTRMEKRFSPLPEPSETETARYQGCKEQAEDVNCLVTFPVQPEPWKWPSNEVGSCSDSRKHSNQLSPRLRPVSPFVLSLPDRCLAPWNTRMLRIYIYIYTVEAKASLFPFLSSLASLFPFLPPSARLYNGRLCIDEGIRIRGRRGLCEFQNRKTSEIWITRCSFERRMFFLSLLFGYPVIG